MKNTIKSQLLVATITATTAVQSLAIDVDTSPPTVSVPEPGMLSLMGVGIVIMLAAKYKNRNK